jgi:hypothetical protein
MVGGSLRVLQLLPLLKLNHIIAESGIKHQKSNKNNQIIIKPILSSHLL